jgi:hypothetical protein
MARAGATLGIGVLIGFLGPTIAADLAPAPEAQASVAENPLARQFINAFIADDQAALTGMKVGADVRLRASRFRADYTKIDAPIHLGSFVGPGYTVHAYAIHVVRGDGSEDTLGWRIVTAGGQVGLLLPPNPIESE